MLETARIVEIWSPATGDSGTVGSGYLLDSKRVLTAGHVVKRAQQRRCQVRPLGSEQWLDAMVTWCGLAKDGLDAAILQLDVDTEISAPTPLGRLVPRP